MRRTTFAAAALLALAAACGDAGQKADPPQSGAASADAAQQSAASQPASATPAAPGAAQPQSPDEVARAINDSIAEGQLYHRRLGSMDTYASCMAKTKGADPDQRAVLEAACKRSQGRGR